MADHNKPTLTSLAADFVTELDARCDDLAMLMDPAYTTVTNPPTNAVRWNSGQNKFQKWNGSAWVDLSANYVLNALTVNASLSVSGTGSTPFVLTRTGATGVYQQFTDSSGSSVYVGANSGTLNIQTPSGGYSTKVAVSDTGLSVTGALSTRKAASDTAASHLLFDDSAGTSAGNWQITTAGKSALWTATAGGSGWGKRLEVGESGLAVTGALSANQAGMTSPLTFGQFAGSTTYGQVNFNGGANTGTLSGILGGSTAGNVLVCTPSGGTITNLVAGTTITNTSSAGLAVTGVLSASAAISTDSQLTISKDGSDAIGLGSLVQIRNAAATRSWATQLSASNNLDWWHLNGSWAKYMTLDTSGNWILQGSSGSASLATYTRCTATETIFSSTNTSGTPKPFKWSVNAETNTAMTLETTGNLSVTGAITSGKILTGTSVNTTSGSAVGFTGIPSWAKRITFGFSGVSTAGATNVGLQIGSGSYAASGYNGTLSQLNGAAGFSSNLSTAVYVDSAANAVNVRHGAVTFTHLGGNLWAWNGVVSCAGSSITCYTAGTIQLGGALDRIQTMLSSADTFDAGSVNINWE